MTWSFSIPTRCEISTNPKPPRHHALQSDKIPSSFPRGKVPSRIPSHHHPPNPPRHTQHPPPRNPTPPLPTLPLPLPTPGPPFLTLLIFCLRILLLIIITPYAFILTTHKSLLPLMGPLNPLEYADIVEDISCLDSSRIRERMKADGAER